jgi:hypothetical protein
MVNRVLLMVNRVLLVVNRVLLVVNRVLLVVNRVLLVVNRVLFGGLQGAAGWLTGCGLRTRYINDAGRFDTMQASPVGLLNLT